MGDLFPPYGPDEGDPGDGGFDPGTGGGDDGSYNLYSLEPGAIFKAGGPALLAHFPADGSLQVDVNSFVVILFDESMNPKTNNLTNGVKVQKASDNTDVAGTFRFANPSGDRALVFEPDDPLEDETEYQVTINEDLTDAQGSAYDPGEGLDSTVFSFTTGKAGDEVTFAVISDLTLPAADETGVSDGASVLVFFTEAVNTDDSGEGLGGDSANLDIQDQDGNTIAGQRSFEFGDRLFIFTPNVPYPSGKRIDVKIASTTEAADGSEALGADYETSFTVLSFPRVTEITFPDNDPLVVLPATINQGVINIANEKEFDVTLKLEGTGKVNKITLLLWDNQSKARIIVLKKSLGAGEHSFTVNLKPGKNPAINDGTISVGAYTTSDVDSPVGPGLELPLLRKDVVVPSIVSLGPPNTLNGDNSLEFLSDSETPIFYGKASESLAEVTITPVFTGTELDPVEAIRFFSMQYPAGSGIYSESVTRGGDYLFITEPVDFTPGGIWPVRDSREDPPIVIKEMVIKDLVGNTKTYSEPDAGSFSSRGFFINNLPGIPEELKILCYHGVTLAPLDDVDVIVENKGSLVTPKSLTWATYTSDPGSGYDPGEAGIADFLGSDPGDRMILTLVKDDFQLLSVVWLYDGQHITASLPLTPETASEIEVTQTVLPLNATGLDLPDVYFGGNRLVSAGDFRLHDAGANPLTTDLTVMQNRIQFIEGLGLDSTGADMYQWAWSNPILPDTAPATQSVLFNVAATTPAADEVQPVEVESKLGATATRYAYVAAKLAGFIGILPLGTDLTELALGGDIYAFHVPLPPSLFVNEVIAEPLETAAFDPPYEVVIEPALGRAVNDTLNPDQALLESQIFYEAVEIGDTGTPRPMVGARFPYAEADLGDPPVSVTLPDGLATPVATSPPAFDFEWDNVLNGGGFGSGAWLLHFENPDASRHWTTYMSYPAAGNLPTVIYLYPDLPGYETAHAAELSPVGNGYDAFTVSGDYPFYVEAFHLTGYLLNASFLSTLEREWKTYWRSDAVIVNNP